MRTCKKCGEAKSLGEFEVYNKAKGWQRWECNSCKTTRVKAWTEQSKDRLKAYYREYHDANREQIIKRAVDWQKANPEKRRTNALAHYYRLQHDAVMAYGGFECACCSEREPMFLSLDHVNNDGREHREQIGSTGGARFYKWLRDNGYPPGFQVLCMNCNHGRHRNGGVCPHKEGATTIPKGSRAKRPEAQSTAK